ncbi:DUF983 domain-containing protein [Aquimarina longa]|uniref:DUF983 domain-containing protein n=1 Tax=Aquimarina longa TaxID=1080221 RepID=UPI00078029F3|nr:DUF983 domain-containing protein [Aquimarina longa]
MFLKGTKLYAILFLKCPRCQEGAFLESSPYNLSQFNKVKERCPECDLKYSLEPSFYYGSMYVSYGVGIAVAVAVYVISLILGLTLTPIRIFIAIVTALIVSMPYIGAVSKSIWASMFFKYDKDIATKIKHHKND